MLLSKEVSSTIFLSLGYKSTRDWTQVSLAIGKLSNYANEPVNGTCLRVCVCVYIYIYIYIYIYDES